METMKRLLWNIMATVSLLIMTTGCGTNEEGGENGEELTFTLTSTDLNCNTSKDIRVNAPFTGKTYTLTVSASAKTVWSVAVESGDLVTVSPSGEQKGNGEIQIVAAANPNETFGKKGVVIIKNNANNKPLRIYFTQSNKELYIPEGTEGQTREEFNSPDSKYNIHCMMESENIAILWDRAFTTNPLSDRIRPFDPEELLEVGEEVYAFMRNDLKFASGTSSYSDMYKLIMFVRYNDEGTAYGGGDKKNKVAILWVSPNHLKDPNHNIIYHEMCHCFQYIAEFDGATDFGGVGTFYEMTSQWSLLQRYPNWIELENSHFKDFMKQTHLALGHKENQYHSPYVLEYWANKHGVDIISKMWQQANATDQRDFIRTYQRITGTNQQKFNEEIYEAATRFITWDLEHIKTAYQQGANIHTCELDLYGDVYAIASTRCPQNYGYNGIKLKVPAAGTTVTINFEGVTSSNNGFVIQKPEKAEWRYGFLAVKTDDTRVYGEMNKVNASSKSGTATFTVPEGTKHLWLVVAATPTEYWHSEDNQWPYEFTLDGTEPDGDKCKVTRK